MHAAPPSPPHSTDLRVDLLETLDALAPHAAALDALIARAPTGCGPFYCVDGLRATAPLLGERESPFLLLAFRGDELVGFAPFVIERKPWVRSGVRRLLLWGSHGNVMGIEGDLLIAPDAEDAVDAIVFALRHTFRGAFDVVDVAFARGDSPRLDRFVALADGAAWTPEPPLAFDIGIDGTIDDYRAARSGCHMKKIGQLERRLARDHAVEWREVAHLSVEETEMVAALHTARQQVLTERGERRTAVFADARTRPALDALLDAAARRGTGWHHLLLADGRLVAFLLTLLDGPVCVAYLTAVDADFGSYRPGSLLHWGVVQRAYQRGGIARIQLGAGPTEIKQIFGTASLRPQHLFWQPPGGLPSRLRVAAWHALRRLRGAG